MKYYVVNTRVYLPEPVAEHFVKCFSLKLPKKYYDVSNTITFRDEENKVSVNIPADQVNIIANALLASALDFYIALGVCTDNNISLYRMIRKAREKVKEILKIDDINLDPEFPICLKVPKG
jgi:ribosome-associated translation inhibitor RaiA